MIDFDKALDFVIDLSPGPERIEELPLDQVVGRAVAENIFCTLEIPPFNRSAMDGFAVRAEDLENLPATLDVVMDIPAGKMPDGAIEKGQAAAVMTGAPVPEGADAVVKVEWTSGFGAEKVTINEGPVTKRLNISPAGEILKPGEIVLKPGAKLGPEEIGLLASIGHDPVRVFSCPKVAVISTGDELIAPARKEPGPSEIYDSNGPALMSFLKEMGIEPVFLGRIKDNKEALRKAVGQGLKYDVLLISGGVSAGAYDFVEDVLDQLKVKTHFRRVAMKPGKPTVFGTRLGRMVFGVPGNPVSAINVARLLVKPALKKMLGHLHSVRSHYQHPTFRARLLSEIKKKPDRLWFVNGVVNFGDEIIVSPIKGRGSADLPNATHANCLIIAPKDVSLIEKDTMVEVILGDRLI